MAIPVTDNAIVRAAPAKVNLSLSIQDTRADSFHDLDMIVVFADLVDKIVIKPDDVASNRDVVTLNLSGPFSTGLLTTEQNLVLSAAGVIKPFATRHLHNRVSLHKEIPFGAGLGGGSGDAAATLGALNNLWQCGLEPDRLAALGLTLGADVPMCLTGRALHARGIGEVITPIEHFPPLAAVLIWPGIALSTRSVFAAFDEDRPRPRPLAVPHFAAPGDVIEHLRRLGNDLEPAAIKLVPEIGHVLRVLAAEERCRLARMTGSGSACFGLFETRDDADQAADRLAKVHPGWWVRPVTLK